MNGSTLETDSLSNQRQNEIEWEDSSKILKCNGCSKTFTLTFRKHHCRACGKVFCGNCSSKKKDLPPIFGYKSPQRVCNECFHYLVSLEYENSLLKPEKPDYQMIEEQLLERVGSITKKDPSAWKKTADSKGVMIEMLQLEASSIYCFKTSVIIQAPVFEAFKIYSEKNRWFEWHPEMQECRTLEPIDKTREVLYIAYKLPIIENRDSCLYSFWTVENKPESSTEKASLYSVSIDHPLCPKKVIGYTRVAISMSYTTFEGIDLNGKCCTKMVSIIHADPKGLIPSFFVNKMLSHACDRVSEMSRYIGRVVETSKTPLSST